MRGEISSAKFSKRHPLDWYVEEGWEWDQIVREIGLIDELADDVFIWDPCAGYGHSGSRLQKYVAGDRIILSDVVDNIAWVDFDLAPRFFSADFREIETAPAERVSIWMNPPYSYQKGIAEQFVRQALRLATHRVVALLPIKWLSSQRRYHLFQEHPPVSVLHFTQRPSMPPGDLIPQMGNRAHRGGMTDYCAIVWDVRHRTEPGFTSTVWLPPLVGGQ